MPAIPAPMIANRSSRPSSTNPVPFARFSVRSVRSVLTVLTVLAVPEFDPVGVT
jgi:hypothetical protein